MLPQLLARKLLTVLTADCIAGAIAVLAHVLLTLLLIAVLVLSQLLARMLLTLLLIAVLMLSQSSSHAAHPTADCSVGAVATPRSHAVLTLLLVAVLVLSQLLARMLLTLLLIAVLVLSQSSLACCSSYCYC
jgi:hypothetical protein